MPCASHLIMSFLLFLQILSGELMSFRTLQLRMLPLQITLLRFPGTMAKWIERRFVDAFGYTHRIIGDYSLGSVGFTKCDRRACAISSFTLSRCFDPENLSKCKQIFYIITDVLSGNQAPSRIPSINNSNERDANDLTRRQPPKKQKQQSN